jgi:LacI family transcriptional regulator
MKSPVDIRAVAQRAGVSIATVSRCLNDKRVSPAAEQRIHAAIKELAYSPNRLARSLRSRQTMTLGMVIPDITNPFFPAVVSGVEETARAARFALMLFNAGEDEEREWECLKVVQALRCDGILLIMAPDGPAHARRRSQLQQFKLPIVYLDRAPDFEADAVVADNLHSAEEAVRHVLALGHRQIGVVAADLAVAVHRDRLEGYRRAMRHAGLTPSAALEARAKPTVADGYAATAHLLARADRPTALFVTSSRLTMGAMSAIEAHGLRCPQDISVIGYDNYEWHDVYHPKMTTVAQPTYLMGARAAELLIRRIAGTLVGPPQQMLLKSTLIIRESTGVCAGAEGEARPAARVPRA